MGKSQGCPPGLSHSVLGYRPRVTTQTRALVVSLVPKSHEAALALTEHVPPHLAEQDDEVDGEDGDEHQGNDGQPLRVV